jgi:REP element-mobilizing transposase RayT
MARKLRLEAEDGIYHVLNRGNYRSDIFRSDKTKAAFLQCLGEACGKTGWRIHAWCLMSNHYHLAVETPRANLVGGMQWLQGTFSTRFNRLRGERGHLFQGRYKSLLVDPAGGLGPLCHYIHLNPVRARVRPVAQLPAWPWSSLHWLMAPRLRPAWYAPDTALQHAGGLKDTPAGRAKYLDYLAWLAEDEPARKEQRFAEMSKGWVIGSASFAKETVRAHAATLGRGRRMTDEPRGAQEAVWRETLAELLRKLRRTEADLAAAGKSAGWKLALAAALKARTTATNRWLGTALHLGNLHEVSRKVAAWAREPDAALSRKLNITPSPKA